MGKVLISLAILSINLAIVLVITTGAWILVFWLLFIASGLLRKDRNGRSTPIQGMGLLLFATIVSYLTLLAFSYKPILGGMGNWGIHALVFGAIAFSGQKTVLEKIGIWALISVLLALLAESIAGYSADRETGIFFYLFCVVPFVFKLVEFGTSMWVHLRSVSL
jgi:hypothetical protein